MSYKDHNPLVILREAPASALLSAPTSRYLTHGRRWPRIAARTADPTR
jgi:hypothetical protein